MQKPSFHESHEGLIMNDNLVYIRKYPLANSLIIHHLNEFLIQIFNYFF